MTATAALVTLDRPRDGVAVITLNRPDKLNALSFELVDELHAVLDEITADVTCHVVVLTGAGRGFCSGLDLGAITGSSTAVGTTGPTKSMLTQGHIASLPIRLHRLRQPVVAAVNGIAVGGGFSLALACDIRVAAPSARFRSQFIRMGLSGCDMGSSYFLPRLVGASRAATLLLTSRDVDADEALAMGLVADVADDALAAAMAIADTLLDYSPFGVARRRRSSGPTSTPRAPRPPSTWRTAPRPSPRPAARSPRRPRRSSKVADPTGRTRWISPHPTRRDRRPDRTAMGRCRENVVVASGGERRGSDGLSLP